MRFQKNQSLLKKTFEHLHVAVENVDKFATRILVAQLRAGAAATFVGMRELYDTDRVSTC